MNLNSRGGRMFARLTALLVGSLGAYLLIIHTTEAVRGTSGYPTSALVIILSFGLMSASGGLLMLLSIDGPARFRHARTRQAASILMVGGSALPHTLTILVLFPSAVLMWSAFRTKPPEVEQAVTSD